jgi:hypothetical protein
VRFFKEHMSERKALKSSSYNRYILGIKNARLVIEQRGKCYYDHDARKMPTVQKAIAKCNTARNKACGEDPNFDVHKRDPTKVMSLFQYKKCVEHANATTDGDMKATLQYLFVMNFLNKCWVRCGNVFSLKLSHVTTLAPMYGPYPLSEGEDNYREDFMAMNTGLKSLLVKTKTDRYFAVGCWRNRYLLLCTIGSLARKLLWEFHHELNALAWEKFMEVDEDGNSPYRDYMVLPECKETVAEAIEKMEDLMGIDRTKSTHFRKDGMTLAQMMGLLRDVATWMSGHSTDKCNTSYVSSLAPQAMKCNAGFFEEPKEKYYVPRANIKLPEVEGPIWRQKLGPFLEVFKKTVGKLSKAHIAEVNFVEELLPLLILVALQDSVYFVGDRELRKNPWATFLVDLLGTDYELWAVKQYELVIAEEKKFDESEHSNQWKSCITGDFLNKDVTKGASPNDLSSQLIQERNTDPSSQSIQERITDPSSQSILESHSKNPSQPALIPPSTPTQQQIVRVSPSTDCGVRGIAKTNLFPETPNIYAVPAKISPVHPHISYDNPNPSYEGYREAHLQTMNLPSPPKPNNIWLNTMPKTVALLVEEYMAKEMYESTCHCRNRKQINKWDNRKYKAFTKRAQVWKEVARQAGLQCDTAHKHYDKMEQVANKHRLKSCSAFREDYCVKKKKEGLQDSNQDQQGGHK